LENKERYTVTAALIYANGPIHIGHLAGCYLPADIYVRFLKQLGKDVVFISGTDEHGVPITLKAKKEGISPQEVVDKYYTVIKKSFYDFGINFDVYSRTTRPIHHKTAQDFFLTLYNKGVFEEKITEQYFDPVANQFLADRYITGTCPKCGYDQAYGDQCEKCGTSLSPTDLINPVSTLTGEKPILKKTKNWFLPLDKMQPDIEKFIDSRENWKSNVYGQCKSWLNQGLQPRAMTRDLDWGVKVPLKDADGKVMYVWFDAPIGYISATKEWAKENNKNWEPYWKDENTHLIHFIGKDNIVFHCIIFPAMLMAHGDYILPENVPANEFLNLEGNKISTSRNWAVWLHEYLEEFPGKQDELRYVLTAIAPETKDSEFTWKDYQARVNNELVAILGNFVNRVVVLTNKYFDGEIPVDAPGTENNPYTAAQVVIQEKINFEYLPKIAQNIMQYKFREALQEMMNIAREGNKYLTDCEPWKRFDKNNPESAVNDEVASELTFCLNIIAQIATIVSPVLPFTANKIRTLLNVKENSIGIEETDKPEKFKLTSVTPISKNHKINKPEMIFEKITDEMVEKQIEKLQTTSNNKVVVEPIKPEATFDDFMKMDIRIGKILEAEKHPNADKLLVLKVDIGSEQRTIVSGIAQYYKPNELVNKQVTVLVNLAPRKLRGIESQGMILMAEDNNGNLSMINPETDFQTGAVVR
jgi:methionyl-tRNA synthetase